MLQREGRIMMRHESHMGTGTRERTPPYLTSVILCVPIRPHPID